jgi:hypothetical protein
MILGPILHIGFTMYTKGRYYTPDPTAERMTAR